MTSLLCRAVLNVDTLQSHWGEWARTIFGENNPHICVLWGVRSCLLCAPSQTSSVQEERPSGSLVGWDLTLPEGRKKGNLMICSVVSRTCKGTLSVPLSVTSVKVPPQLYSFSLGDPGFPGVCEKQVCFVCKQKPKLSEQDVNL